MNTHRTKCPNRSRSGPNEARAGPHEKGPLAGQGEAAQSCKATRTQHSTSATPVKTNPEFTLPGRGRSRWSDHQAAAQAAWDAGYELTAMLLWRTADRLAAGGAP